MVETLCVLYFTSHYSYINSTYEDLKPLTFLDPLLLPLLMNICQSQEVPSLIPHIPPYLSAAYISKAIKELRLGEDVSNQC